MGKNNRGRHKCSNCCYLLENFPNNPQHLFVLEAGKYMEETILFLFLFLFKCCSADYGP